LIHTGPGIDGDKDAGLFLHHGGGRLGLVDVDPRLLDEGGRDDEEDQHDEDHVEHRRDIDAALVARC
jgi:hypothetical protein